MLHAVNGLPIVAVEPTIREGQGITGYFVRFANEMTLSVQWGRGNYSNVPDGCPSGDPSYECAIWYPWPRETRYGRGRAWYRVPGEGDDVIAGCRLDEVIRLATLAAALPPAVPFAD